MPLVYPPNFEGVGLTYEFVGAYILFDFETDINNAIPITLSTGNLDPITVEPQNVFFYMSVVDNALRIRGFVNSDTLSDVLVTDNDNHNTYYYGLAGTTRENDSVFLLFNCRMALNGTFSNPIRCRFDLEMGVTYANDLVEWSNVCLSAILDLAQSQN